MMFLLTCTWLCYCQDELKQLDEKQLDLDTKHKEISKSVYVENQAHTHNLLIRRVSVF